MDQSYRVCKRKGHDEQVVYHICTLQECDQPTRWCCSHCINQAIHNHEKPNNFHVIKTNDLLLKLKSQSEKYEENQCLNNIKPLQILEKIVKMCQELENSIVYFRKHVESQIQNISNFKNLVINNYEQLDDIMINELIQINLQQVFTNRSILPLDNIKQQLYQIEYIIKDFQENNKDYSELIIDFKNRKYITQQIAQEDYVNYYGSSISKNQLYLAYGGVDWLLNIYDMKLKKLNKEIKIDDCITCSNDEFIIKTDIKSQQQMFKLTGTDLIKAMIIMIR